MIHILMALILVGCALSPVVETALDCHGNVFTTGCDGETTLACIVLLLELALSLASLLAFLCPNFQLKDRIVDSCQRLTLDLVSCVIIPDASPPVPLRI
jgi:hypothetical protein